MSDKQFVDTNVLVYAYDVSAGAKHERARALLEEFWESGTGCLSIQVLQEFYVNVTRKVAHPLDSETALQVVTDLGEWPVHSPTIDDVVAAIELHSRHSLSFWDAMILMSASRLGCDAVLSEDMNAGQSYDGVKVINPFVAEAGVSS